MWRWCHAPLEMLTPSPPLTPAAESGWRAAISGLKSVATGRPLTPRESAPTPAMKYDTIPLGCGTSILHNCVDNYTAVSGWCSRQYPKKVLLMHQPRLLYDWPTTFSHLTSTTKPSALARVRFVPHWLPLRVGGNLKFNFFLIFIFQKPGNSCLWVEISN